MRQAPPVTVCCPGGGSWRLAHVLLFAAAGVLLAVWAALHAALAGAAVGALGAACGLAGAVLGWCVARPRAVQLHWDGGRWLADDEPGEVGVMLDLGGWLLLRWTAPGRRALWLPLSDAQAGGARHALRSALYARVAGVPAPGAR